MKNETKIFIDFCLQNFEIKEANIPNKYNSLPVCILDDIFSLRAKYETMTLKVVQRFANYFLKGDLSASGYRLEDFIRDIDSLGSKKISFEILKNMQMISNRQKLDVCYEIARKLILLDIHDIEGFRNYHSDEILEIVLRSVKGVGDAAVNYLFMLAGDENRVKPDVHIHRSLFDALGYEVSNEECQIIFREAANELKKQYPFVTPAKLDNIVWKHYSGAKFY